MHNFLYQTVPVFPVYIYYSQKVLIHFSFRVLTFGLGVLKKFGPNKIMQEKLIKFIKSLSYIKSSYIVSCPKMFQYPQVI